MQIKKKYQVIKSGDMETLIEVSMYNLYVHLILYNIGIWYHNNIMYIILLCICKNPHTQDPGCTNERSTNFIGD